MYSCIESGAVYNTVCSEQEFQCVESGICINGGYICNGRDDCGDNSDEDNPECREFIFMKYCYIHNTLLIYQ